MVRQVEDINLKSYYSNVPPKRPTRTNRPTVFKTENASFEFDKKRNHRNVNVDVEPLTDFKLSNINVDISKVIVDVQITQMIE